MKTFKKILSEVAQPKSAEEKRFKDQHTIELIKHPVALDSQFTGEIEGLTKKKNLADVTPGEDETKYDQAYAVKNKPFKMPRNIDEEKQGRTFKALIDKLAEETSVDLNETPEEEIPMMMRQLHFIAYAADEIMEYLAIDGLDPEEWWQNKLAYAFAQMKSLHAYVEGDKRMSEPGDDDDLMAAYESAMSEILDEEDEIEEITETMVNMKAGMLKLKNNKTVKLDTKEATMLNKMFKSLNAKNKKEMHDLLTKDEKGFDEILSFAKEAGV
jgi:hypothetical protein